MIFSGEQYSLWYWYHSFVATGKCYYGSSIFLKIFYFDFILSVCDARSLLYGKQLQLFSKLWFLSFVTAVVLNLFLCSKFKQHTVYSNPLIPFYLFNHIRYPIRWLLFSRSRIVSWSFGLFNSLYILHISFHYFKLQKNMNEVGDNMVSCSTCR